MLTINEEKSSYNLILLNRNKKNKFERRLYRYKSHKITKEIKELVQDEIDYNKSKKSIGTKSQKNKNSITSSFIKGNLHGVARNSFK